jgi:hypothetical protein
MKTGFALLVVAWLTLCGYRGVVAREGGREDKNLPGTAAWELGALRVPFRIAKTEYDDRKKQVKWTVETKDGYRTADFVRGIDRDRPFTFLFFDGETQEVGRVELRAADFQGIPKTRVMKEGTRLTVTLDVPKAMPRVKKVVVRRGRVE